mmetsp:Transcript_19438/g.53469  ORF Transcript_19438/g.53469 Transcript_19438/m.53469 type:complete len:397 (+) Transcript_19438:1081-2271(+)
MRQGTAVVVSGVTRAQFRMRRDEIIHVGAIRQGWFGTARCSIIHGLRFNVPPTPLMGGFFKAFKRRRGPHLVGIARIVAAKVFIVLRRVGQTHSLVFVVRTRRQVGLTIGHGPRIVHRARTGRHAKLGIVALVSGIVKAVIVHHTSSNIMSHRAVMRQRVGRQVGRRTLKFSVFQHLSPAPRTGLILSIDKGFAQVLSRRFRRWKGDIVHRCGIAGIDVGSYAGRTGVVVVQIATTVRTDIAAIVHRGTRRGRPKGLGDGIVQHVILVEKVAVATVAPAGKVGQNLLRHGGSLGSGIRIVAPLNVVQAQYVIVTINEHSGTLVDFGWIVVGTIVVGVVAADIIVVIVVVRRRVRFFVRRFILLAFITVVMVTSSDELSLGSKFGNFFRLLFFTIRV